MTLKDLLMAGAPAVPDWFEPTVPPKPEQPFYEPVGDNGEYPTEEERALLLQWRSGEIERPNLSSFSYWCDAWGLYREKYAEWKRNRERERLLQWPLYYAEEVMKRLDGERERGHHGGEVTGVLMPLGAADVAPVLAELDKQSDCLSARAAVVIRSLYEQLHGEQIEEASHSNGELALSRGCEIKTLAETALKEWESWVRDQLEGTEAFVEKMGEINDFKQRLEKRRRP